MPLSRIALVAVATALLCTTAYADTTTNPPATHEMGGHGMMRGMFTSEERMMLFADAAKATAGMTDEQRHTYRHAEFDRIMAMSDADRAKFKGDLDARWNALSPDQKADMTAKMQAFMAARHAHDADK